jgi:hypothetical protein
MSSKANEAESQAGLDIKQLLEKRVVECDYLISEIAKAFTDWFRKDHESSFDAQCPGGVPDGLWKELGNQLVKDGSLVEFHALSRAQYLGRLAHYFKTRTHPEFHKARDGARKHFDADKTEIKELHDEWNPDYNDQDVIDGKLSDRVHKKFLSLQKRRNPAWFTELQVLRGASIESTIVGLWLPLGLWLYSSGDACLILSEVLDNLPRLIMPFSYYLEPRTPITRYDRAIGLLGSSKPMRKITPHHVDSAVSRNCLFRATPPPWRLP